MYKLLGKIGWALQPNSNTHPNKGPIDDIIGFILKNKSLCKVTQFVL